MRFSSGGLGLEKITEAFALPKRPSCVDIGFYDEELADTETNIPAWVGNGDGASDA